MERPHLKANALVNETSPYLLQHAYNPVDWVPYSKAAFDQAKRENKPVLISIGYSACHWCHVMERECFEDEEVASEMNRNFVNIKVDREEHGDVDMLYMQALQFMNGQGGWPLNCFVLPDGRPFYGGTYFPKMQWLKVLRTLSELYLNDKEKVIRYASGLTEGIKKSEELLHLEDRKGSFTRETLRTGLEKWKKGFDPVHGGPNRAPKFPMPANYRFLLRYGKLSRNEEVLAHVKLTLDKMATSGLYDQLRGGFARYSTDMMWKVPHFEKMLYDNAQLCSLYTEGWQHFKSPLYKEVVYNTLSFVEKEWMGGEACFYSAYDADSEGEEGKYYVWSEEELKAVLGNDLEIFKNHYEINPNGYWEHGNYILMRSERKEGFEIGLSENEKTVLDRCIQKLIKAAESRTKPGLDDKSLCSWNALMCSAFAEAGLAFGEEKFRVLAKASVDFILKKFKTAGGELFRTYKNGEAKIPAFLEDYAFLTEALLKVYQIFGEESYLHEAKSACELALDRFHNPAGPLLYYSQPDGLPVRTTEISDNVIPASNSQMALNLFYLSRYFDQPEWENRARNMLESVAREFEQYPPGYGHWANLALHLNYPFYELVVVGKNVDEKLRRLGSHGLTNTILALSRNRSELPLLKNRHRDNKTLIYVCRDKSCGLPVESLGEALRQFELD